MQRSICIAVLMVLGIGPNGAADRANGERLAQRWCASCHMISADQRQASDAAPPFSSIATLPQFDAPKLAFFLLEPHPKMPTMALSRSDADDLAAFIATSP
jgi:mono/diheme cytochrome c family protein